MQKRWTQFAAALSAEQCERIVLRAHARRLAAQRIERCDDAQATEGWNLESRGYVPHALVHAAAEAPRQAALPLGAR